MADFTVGQAQIKLVPSFQNFSEAVDAEMAKQGDAAGAAFGDAFEARTADLHIGVNLDDAAAKFGIDSLKVDTDELAAKSPTITPKVDDSQAVPKLAAIKTAADAAAGGSGSGGGLFGLASAAASLGPALVPIGATLVAGIASLAPALVSAGAGLGAFALAAGGDFSTLENAAKSTLTSFQQLEKPIVQPVITGALKDLIPVFSDLAPLVDSTASELTKLENSASSALNAPFWHGFTTFLASEAGPAIGAFSSVAGGLATTFAGVSEAMGPLITDLEGDLDGIGNKLTSFGQTVGSSSGFQSFLTYVQQEAPVVGQLFLNLGDDAGKFVGDLAPLGAGILTVLDPLTKFAGTLLSIHGPFGTNAADVLAAGFAYSKLKGPISDAATGFHVFGAAVDNVVAGDASGLKGAEGALANLVGNLGGIGSAAGLAAPLVVGVGAAIFATGNEAAQTAKAVNAFFDGVTNEATSSLPDLTKKLDDLNTKMEDIPAAVGAGTLGFNDYLSATSKLKDAIAQTQAAQTLYGDNVTSLAGKLGISKDAVTSLASSIGINLSTALVPAQIQQFNAALQEQASKAGLSKSALEALAKSAGISTAEAESKITGAVNATTSAFASFGNAVTQFSSGALPATQANITQFYAESELQGATFSQNIQKAIKDGYSPTLISSLLQAGPAQASSLLQGIVSAQGTGLKNLIDQSTSALATEGAAAIEEARLTEEAVTSKSADFAKALPEALAISQALTTTNAAQQLAALATTYNTNLSGLQKIAGEYGFAIPSAIQSQVSATTQASQSQLATYFAQLNAGTGPAKTAGSNVATSAAHGFSAVDFSPLGAAALIQYANSLTENGSNKTIAAAAKSAAAAANTAADAVKGLFVGTGTDLISGMAAGMATSQALDAVGSAAAAAVSLAVAKAKAEAQISSPSQLMADEVGTYLTQGIAIGMVDPTAVRTLQVSVDQITKTLTDSLTRRPDSSRTRSPHRGQHRLGGAHSSRSASSDS